MEATMQRAEEALTWTVLLARILRRKWWVLSGALAVMALGSVYALLSPSVYDATAVISPKQQQGGAGGSLLSQMGGLGGLIGGLGGANTGLERLQILVKSRDVVEAVVRDNNLMPELFPGLWDAQAKAWKTKRPEDAPTVREAVEQIRGTHLEVIVNPKLQTVDVRVFASNPELARRMAGYFVDELNKKIRDDVRSDAEVNKSYLEEQLASAVDPLLREKIQNMIASEIEKAMLVGSKSFEVLEKPVAPLSRLKPKRKQMVVMSFLLGLFASGFAAVVWEGLHGNGGGARRIAGIRAEKRGDREVEVLRAGDGGGRHG
jgi:uncharacterized protein involved in exopolysaccharide biosynthesis